MNSSMVVTAPLDAPTWATIGWGQPVTLRTAAHAYLYAQRTADGRIAIGGRGVPYRWASGTDDRGRRAPGHRAHPGSGPARSVASNGGRPPMEHDLVRCARRGPGTGARRSTSTAVPRAGSWAGGYVGDGVATSHLAGLTLADLITGTTSNSPSWRRRPPQPGLGT